MAIMRPEYLRWGLYFAVLFCVAMYTIAFTRLLLADGLGYSEVAPALALAETSSDGNEAAHTGTDDSYLVVNVRGGLTNQQLMIMESIFVAKATNRTLMLPSVRSRIPLGEYYAGSQVPPSPMDELWNSSHFIQCANNLGARVSRKTVSSLPRSNYQFRDWDLRGAEKTYAVIPGKSHGLSELAALFANDTSTVINIENPYGMVNSRLSSQGHECFVPSSRLEKMALQYQQAMPEDYTCLHARVESDWYKACCRDEHPELKLIADKPDTWTCDNGKQPSTRCYKSPTQISSTLVNSSVLANSTVWIASGASIQHLHPLYNTFQARQLAKRQDVYMDYGLAIVEREVCLGATQVWAVDKSTTFGRSMSNKRPIKYYGPLP